MYSKSAFSEIDTTLLIRMIIHDLDAPLSVINRIMDRIRIGRFDPNSETQMRIVKSSTSALDRIRRMLQDMQEVASGREIKVRLEDIQLEQLGDLIAQEFIPVAAAESQRLSYTCQDIIIQTDLDLFMRIAINFLMNALHHNTIGNPIIMKLTGDRNGKYSLIVQNTGAIIPENHLEDIFHPGIQLELKISRKWRGHGLGLAFCRLAAQALGGTVKAENLPDQSGVRFSFCVG